MFIFFTIRVLENQKRLHYSLHWPRKHIKFEQLADSTHEILHMNIFPVAGSMTIFVAEMAFDHFQFFVHLSLHRYQCPLEPYKKNF